MSIDKSIAVTEETYQCLVDVKSAGQIYDDVIDNPIEEHEKAALFARI